MTKLRRLDPQPADLTTHKGPFVSEDGSAVRLLCRDLNANSGKTCVWAITCHLNGKRIEDSLPNGKMTESGAYQFIFAAEEIREPIVEFRVYDDTGIFGVYTNQKEAEYISRHIGGTIKKFVQDTSYDGTCDDR